MSDKTNLMLSDVELQFVKDTTWVLTKQRIIGSVYHLFNEQVGEITYRFKNTSLARFPAICAAAPKITRGEHYRSLPYVILDYPAAFDKENIFALRTMFWWGNFVSVTMHISGIYKNKLQQIVLKNLQKDSSEFFICINEDQWEHHFEADNYNNANELIAKDNCIMWAQAPFIKLALKIDLKEWNEMSALLKTAYHKMAGLLMHQLPTR